MSDEDALEVVDERPREVRRGHLTQIRGHLNDDDRVRVRKQKRVHRFDSGTHDSGPPRPVWSGSVEDAKVLHEILEALLYDEEEVNFAGDPGRQNDGN